MIWGAFSVSKAEAQFITDASVIFQLQHDSYSDVLSGTSQWTARIGTGWSASTTGFNLFASTTIINAASQNFRVDIQGYDNSGYTGSVLTCAYDSQNRIPVGFYEGIIRVDNFFTGSQPNCVLKPNLYYKIAVSFGPQSSAISQVKGVNQSVVPFDVESSNINLGVPFIMMKATLSSLDPNLINAGNPSGISTSTIQSYCNSSYATSTGLFSDLSNAVTYGACTALAFLFVPNQNTLRDFGNLGSSTQSKIPFSYYYDFASILNGSAASSSTNFTVLSVDLRATGVGSTSPWATVLPSSFAYLSSTTITTYVSPTLYDLMFLLMRSAIWLAVLFHIYHRLIPKRATHV